MARPNPPASTGKDAGDGVPHHNHTPYFFATSTDRGQTWYSCLGLDFGKKYLTHFRVLTKFHVIVSAHLAYVDHAVPPTYATSSHCNILRSPL